MICATILGRIHVFEGIMLSFHTDMEKLRRNVRLATIYGRFANRVQCQFDGFSFFAHNPYLFFPPLATCLSKSE